MKRYIKTAYVISFVALALAGCSKTEEFQTNSDSALQIESVSGISPFDLMQNQASKAVITGESLPSDEAAKGIGLFVTADDGGAYDGHDSGYTNVKYTFDGSKWSTQSPIYLSSNEGNLYGYFPYNPDATDLRAIPVESSLNGTDYLYADIEEVSHSDKTVKLQMNHALSRLHLTIKKGKNFTAEATLSEITLKSAAIDATGTMDLTGGTITPSKKSGETGIVEVATDGEITAQGIEKDILIVPADGTEGKKDIAIILTIGGKLASVSLSGENGIDIRSGIQNNLTLTVEDTGIKVTGVGVGTWGEGGSQTVEVSGHTVTVKIADDVPAGDIMHATYVDGINVIIRASSFQGKRLVCNVGDNAQCDGTVTNDKYTFTISEISSDIDAVLGYVPTVTLTLTFNSNGKVWIGDDESKTTGQFQIGQQVVIHAAPNDNFRLFIWNDNNRETSRTITVGDTDTEYSASFISSDLIPGLFTVAADENGNATKQVFFSKGNLYCSGVDFDPTSGFVRNSENAQWGFEANQYDTKPSSRGDRDENHISHFMWCSTSEKAMALKYDSNWNGESPFFAEKNFTVNGYSGWSVLTRGSGGEWDYLLNTRTMKYSKPRYTKVFGVSIGGVTCNGLFIYPDDYSGNEVVASGGPSTWADINAAGIVFLPAAGYRDGFDGKTNVSNAGSHGYYWSASPNGNYQAFDLYFNRDSFNPIRNDDRNQAYSVRLVTESK